MKELSPYERVVLGLPPNPRKAITVWTHLGFKELCALAEYRKRVEAEVSRETPKLLQGEK